MRLINEENKHLAAKMIKVTLSVKMNQDAHVPDTMTRVRVLPTVAVVGQSDRVERSSAGGTVMDIYVKFLPNPGSLFYNLMNLCKLIKSLPGVRVVRVVAVGNRPVIFKGRPIVI
jgi:hypothetical protein